MKKILTAILAALMILSLCACGEMCDICGHKKAVKSYENAFGETIHACGDCYKEVKELSE